MTDLEKMLLEALLTFELCNTLCKHGGFDRGYPEWL